MFAAHLHQVPHHAVEDLRLGSKTEQLLAEAEKLHKQVTEYAYGPPPVRFTDPDVDQARAAGVLIELERSAPIITDRSLYRELCKQAIRRTVEELRGRAAEQAEQLKQATAAGRPVDPEAEARREHGRRMRQLAEQAHGANLDLGRSLLNGLACVDPSDMTVARLMVFSLLGPDWDQSPYTQAGERICELAARGVRLVIEEFRTDVTKTRKDGTRGALRVDYGDPRAPEQAIAWIWRWLDCAKTAGDLYGRCIVILAAEQYASRLVAPASQRQQPIRWGSHKDQARKALAKLAGPHLPASLKQLERAVAKANAERGRGTHHISTRQAAAADTTTAGIADPDADATGEQTDETVGSEAFEREDLGEDESVYELAPAGGVALDVAGTVGPDGAVYSDAEPGM